MKRWMVWMALSATLLAAGCARDMRTRLASDQGLATEVMNAYRSDGELAGRMVDHLLGSDTTRAVVIDRMLANGQAAQLLMMRTAQDRDQLNGVIALAVQDSAMKDHVIALLKGIEMGRGAR